MPTVLTPAPLLTTAPPQPPAGTRSRPGVLRNGVSVVLALVMLLGAVDELAARFRPKEYDLTLTTQAKNCEIRSLDQGVCQGGNWALAFAEGLSLTKCLTSTTKQPRLSGEELLRCTQASFETCATRPRI
jgi:hypothetical protein